MSYPMRRNYGRRKYDRFRFAAGMGCTLLLGMGILQLNQCGAPTVTGPDAPVAQPSSQPAAATPVTAQPAAALPEGNGRECSLSGTTLYLKNTDPIRHSYTGWSTDFDQGTIGAPHSGEINPGDSFDHPAVRGFCEQLDIAHEYNGSALCYAFLDKDGKPFNPSSAPAKVTECRTKPCNEEENWFEDKTPNYGEWSSCSANNVESTSLSNGNCSKKRTVTYWSTNECSQERRSRTIWETESCECPPVGVCHVSNKGKDGNVDLVVDFKTDGKGHEKHVTDSKYCPNDWYVYGPLATGFGDFEVATKPKKFECKTEGKDTEEYCSCEQALDAAKKCGDD